MEQSAGKDLSIPIVEYLNNFVKGFASLTAWFNVILIGIIVAQVTLRYGFNNGSVTLEELMWHFYAVAFMFGLSYAFVVDSHIRVDIIHMNLPTRLQHIFEILGILLLLMPFLWVLFDHSLGWVAGSYAVDEGSPSPQGLPNRWIIKAVIPIACVLIFIAAIARLIREAVMLFVLHNVIEPKEETPGRVRHVRSMFLPYKNSISDTEDKGEA